MTRRYGLRGDQWERIKHILPGREEDVGATATDNRLLFTHISTARALIQKRPGHQRCPQTGRHR